jgi:DNA-binding XRE family transcriptional regulator
MAKSGPRLRGSGKKQQIFLSLLRAIREEAGLSQKELAGALGLEQTIVSKVEHGVRRGVRPALPPRHAAEGAPARQVAHGMMANPLC